MRGLGGGGHHAEIMEPKGYQWSCLLGNWKCELGAPVRGVAQMWRFGVMATYMCLRLGSLGKRH